MGSEHEVVVVCIALTLGLEPMERRGELKGLRLFPRQNEQPSSNFPGCRRAVMCTRPCLNRTSTSLQSF